MTNFNMSVLHVVATKTPPIRTKINIRSRWLADSGFAHGAPVFVTPQQDGFTLELGANGGGKMLHVGIDGRMPSVTVNLAKNFSTTGLSAGDFLAARYGYGIIEAKKLPAARKYYVVGLDNFAPFLQLSGGWLNDAGFIPDAVATVAATDGGVMLRVWDGVTESYGDFVKFARASKTQIIQPRKNQSVTTIDIPGYILVRSGFDAGGICGVHYEYGAIKLFKPDLRRLGF